jgi:light-regulated signal transduction histidine kinase (bacteriophytochrome)
MADQVADSLLRSESISTRAPGIAVSAVRVATASGDLLALNSELEARVSQRTAELEVANRDLKAANRDLEVANRDLEAFSYTVAHDLRAPLRAIDGFAEILESEYSSELSSAGIGHLGRIREGSARMATLIRDLLEFSRLSRIDLQRQTVAMRPLVDRVVAGLVAGSPGREVKVEIGELAPCEGDERMLQQVIANLLSNAWKFTVAEKAASVEIGSEIVAGTPSYFVRDNGIGFNSGFAEKVFEVFQRAHSLDDFPGTGIGLASVKRIVLRHGGRVWAESQPGQGATFHFSLEGAAGG